MLLYKVFIIVAVPLPEIDLGWTLANNTHTKCTIKNKGKKICQGGDTCGITPTDFFAFIFNCTFCMCIISEGPAQVYLT